MGISVNTCVICISWPAQKINDRQTQRQTQRRSDPNKSARVCRWEKNFYKVKENHFQCVTGLFVWWTRSVANTSYNTGREVVHASLPCCFMNSHHFFITMAASAAKTWMLSPLTCDVQLPIISVWVKLFQNPFRGYRVTAGTKRTVNLWPWV